MRRILQLAALLFLASPAWATFTVAQLVDSGSSCSTSSNTCALTISSSGSGHLGIITWMTGTSTVVSSIAGAGTWTTPAGCQIYTAATGTVGCSYTLSTTSGSTSVTITWSGSSPGFPTHFTYYEYSFSGSSIALDSGASGGLGTASDLASSSPVGVALTLAGSNDAIFQGIVTASGTASAISGGYTFDTTASQAGQGAGHIINTASGAAPSWTVSVSSVSRLEAIAISEATAVACTPTLTLMGEGHCG
jgi:hypothetical protein